ncbi:MAG: MarR family winged helix-turn-helix transcriptional regulator [Steroidobacteraceae bacterium]
MIGARPQKAKQALRGTRAAAGRGAPAAAAQARIAYSVGRLERALRRELGRATRRFGLTVAQYTALSVLEARGELSNAQLARRSFVTPQAMHEIVLAMARKAIVAREPDAHHGRIVRIALTREGERVLRQCDAAAERVEERMLGRLSRAERARFGALLRMGVEALEPPRKPREGTARAGVD